MSTAVQRRRGTTAQHASFAGLNGELTVDTDKEVVVVHDGATAGGYPMMRENGSNSALALGSAGTPSLKFTGDTNTGIYSPGADQVAISTGGSGRVFVDASGRVGLGVASSSADFLVGQGTSAELRIGSNGSFYGSVHHDFNTAVVTIGQYGAFGAAGMRFLTQGNERLRIDSSGRVGVGTSSPTNALLHVSSATAGAAIKSEDTGSTGSFLRILGDASSQNLINWKTGTALRFASSDDNYGSFAERLRITSAGLVGVGTSSPAQRLHISGSNAGGFQVTNADNSDAISLFVRGGNAINSTTDNAVLHVGQRSDVSIITTGRVGIGTSSPSSISHIKSNALGASCFAIENQANTFKIFEITNAASGNCTLNLRSGGGVDRFVVDDSGRVGIGSTNPGTYNANLAVYSAGGAFVGALHANASGTFPKASAISLGSDAVSYTYTTGGASVALTGSAHIAALQSASSGAGTDIVFINTAGGSVSEKARLTSSGQWLVGTSTSTKNLRLDQKLAVVSTGAGNYSGVGITSYIGTSADAGSFIDLNRSRGTTDGSMTSVASGDTLGWLVFQGADGTNFVPGAWIKTEVDGTPGTNNMPGRISLWTTASGASSPTERVRINSNGFFTANSRGGSIPTGDRHAFYSTTSLPGLSVRNNNNVSGDTCLYLTLGGSNTNNVSSNYIQCDTDSVGNVFFVRGNGNVQNTNNSYTAISDVKLKENIVDANSQWDDIKALQVRNYNLKKGQTHKQIGLIAQEVEPISPGLVYEFPDRDEDGNDLGTVTKSVNYSVLYMKAVKALQEAMERIEQLEAKVAALESA